MCFTDFLQQLNIDFTLALNLFTQNYKLPNTSFITDKGVFTPFIIKLEVLLAVEMCSYYIKKLYVKMISCNFIQ